MKILTELEIKHNINTFHGMSLEEQQELRMNNGYYIIDLSMKFSDHVSKSTVSAAMLITTYFFLKKDYLEYDRFLIATAAFYFAAKLNNEHRRIDYFVMGYYKIGNRLKGVEIDPPLEKAEKEDLVDLIIEAEIAIVKVMFSEQGSIIGTDLPYKYVYDYIRSLFMPREQFIIFEYVYAYVNDLFFTTLPLIYGPKEIALAGVMISSRQLGIEISAVDEAKWYRMVNDHCDFDDVLAGIQFITKFFTDQMKINDNKLTLPEKEVNTLQSNQSPSIQEPPNTSQTTVLASTIEPESAKKENDAAS